MDEVNGRVTKQIWARLTEEELQQLDQVAERLDMTRSATIRQAIVLFLQQVRGDDD